MFSKAPSKLALRLRHACASFGVCPSATSRLGLIPMRLASHRLPHSPSALFAFLFGVAHLVSRWLPHRISTLFAFLFDLAHLASQRLPHRLSTFVVFLFGVAHLHLADRWQRVPHRLLCTA